MINLAHSQLLYKVKRINGDTLTPVAVFNRLEGKKKFLLESSLKHDENGRYSFIGMNPYLEFVAHGNQVKVEDENRQILKEELGPSLTILKELLPTYDIAIDFPFSGGAIGYIGYDAIRQYENIGEVIEDELHIPDVHLMFYQDVVIFDHRTQTINIVVMNLDQKRTEEELEKRIVEIEDSLFKMKDETPRTSESIPFKPSIGKEEFMKMVELAKEYIHKGDIFQVVLSQRMKGPIQTDPFQYYRKLRNANPSPYMFFIDFDEYIVLGASPESLIKTKGNQLITNPIAGTRARGTTKEQDVALEKELLQDEKELAEHKMLVDLSRNDVGRVCQPGTIQIPKYMQIERYQHVMHIVSEVQGTLKDHYSSIDALISCLPAGTVSGAPKIRAMQIINELERSKRGVYAGAVGYININGDIDFALAIRSLLIKNQVAYLQTGAGVVYDSIPENEYNETLNKARALLEVNKDDSFNR